MAADFHEIKKLVETGEVCEIRYTGRACELITVISNIVHCNVEKGVIVLPNDRHIRVLDIVSIVPITKAHP